MNLERKTGIIWQILPTDCVADNSRASGTQGAKISTQKQWCAIFNSSSACRDDKEDSKHPLVF
jgi:hypothetical protein